MAYQEQEQYFRVMYPHAKRAADATGLQVSVVLAQWALETGYGKSALAVNANNHGGIKYVRQAQATGAYDGQHASYSDISQFVADYIRVMNLSYYTNVRGRSTPEATIQALHESPYAEDPKYDEKVSWIYRTFGLSGYDTYSGGSNTIGQTGIIDQVKTQVEGMGADDIKKFAGIGLVAALMISLIKTD